LSCRYPQPSSVILLFGRGPSNDGLKPDFGQKLHSVLFKLLGSANVSQTRVGFDGNLGKTPLPDNLDKKVFFH